MRCNVIVVKINKYVCLEESVLLLGNLNGWVNESARGFCFFGTYQKPCVHLKSGSFDLHSTAVKGKTGKRERR
jgi:hypothetical protein